MSAPEANGGPRIASTSGVCLIGKASGFDVLAIPIDSFVTALAFPRETSSKSLRKAVVRRLQGPQLLLNPGWPPVLRVCSISDRWAFLSLNAPVHQSTLQMCHGEAEGWWPSEKNRDARLSIVWRINMALTIRGMGAESLCIVSSLCYGILLYIPPRENKNRRVDLECSGKNFGAFDSEVDTSAFDCGYSRLWDLG